MLVLVASAAGATIANPSFETASGTTLANWSFAGSTGFSGGADDEFVTQGLLNARVFSQCGLQSICPSFTQGSFAKLTQSIDFTGVTKLVVDVQLRQGGGTSGIGRWDTRFAGAILIDDAQVWSSNLATTLTNLELTLPSLSGIHSLVFQLLAREDMTSATGSNHFNVDNLRMIGGVVPEPGTAALTGLGLLLLGGARRRQNRRDRA